MPPVSLRGPEKHADYAARSHQQRDLRRAWDETKWPIEGLELCALDVDDIISARSLSETDKLWLGDSFRYECVSIL